MRIYEIVDPTYLEYQRRKGELERLRAADPLKRHVAYMQSREGDDTRYHDPEYARKQLYYEKLRKIHHQRWKEMTTKVNRLGGEVRHNKYKHLPTGMFVMYDTVPGVESPAYLDELGQLIHQQNETLDIPASTAIDSFVGHAHGFGSYGDVGFMSHQKLEDAFSNTPSSQGQLARQQLEAGMAPIKAALKSRFGPTLYLYRSQEPLQPGKPRRNVLSWTASKKFANYHGGEKYSKIEREIPVDDIVWITDRANQQEFIIMNRQGAAHYLGESAEHTIVVGGVRRPIHNSQGEVIAPTTDAQVEFWRWFGKSKIVDQNGRPLVVYHGDKPGKTSFTGRDRSSYIQGNIFFTNQRYVAKGYTPHRTNSYIASSEMDHTHGLYSAYLKIEKPVVVDAKGEDWSAIPLSSRLKKTIGSGRLQIDDLALHVQQTRKNDGLIVKNVWDQFGDGDQLIVFSSQQIRLVNSP